MAHSGEDGGPNAIEFGPTPQFIDLPDTRKLIKTKAWDELADALSERPVADAANVLVLLDDSERGILCKRLAHSSFEPAGNTTTNFPSMLEMPYATLVKAGSAGSLS